MKICKFCGTEVGSSETNCPQCGGDEFKFKCGNCQTVFEKAVYCPNCGVKATAQARICPSCGTKFYKNICPDCGYRVGSETVASAPTVAAPVAAPVVVERVVERQVVAPPISANTKNKWVAFLLCLLLGYIGAHKFYEGKTGMGILYFFTVGLFGIGWIVDTILLLGKPEHYIP